MRSIGLTVAASVLSSSVALAGGLPLCVSPVMANDFYNNLLQAKGAGVNITPDIIINVANKSGCSVILYNKNAKPIAFVAGQLKILDGEIQGWTAPDLYILFVNSHTK